MVKASTVLELVFPYGTFDEAWDDTLLAKKWLIKRIKRQGEEVQKNFGAAQDSFDEQWMGLQSFFSTS